VSVVATSTVGTVDWLDLSTPDVIGSMEFYAGVFDWDFHRSDAELGTYYTARIGTDEVAGLMERAPEVPAFVPAMWAVFVRVDSADASTARAQLIGGSVIEPPFDIPGSGRIAVLADPAGAVFSVISGAEGLGMIKDHPGAMAGCEILTRDIDAARHFYTDMFGWSATVDLDSGYITMTLDDREVAGLMAMPPEVPADAPSHWLPYFGTDDCERACAAAREAGGSIAMPVRAFDVKDAHVKMAVVEDPVGAMFGLIEHVV
jgi:predicted enzyme related to lactoylglutathione lyase